MQRVRTETATVPLRGRIIAALLLATVAVAGCSRSTSPGPQATPGTANTASALLSTQSLSALPQAGDGGGWSLVSGADDYTPSPCGVRLPSASSGSVSSATWRNGTAVLQLHVQPYGTAEAAAKAAKQLHAATVRCTTWLEGTAPAAARPLHHPATGTVYAGHVTVLGAAGRQETAVVMTQRSSALVSVVVSTESAGDAETVDAVASAAASQVASH